MATQYTPGSVNHERYRVAQEQRDRAVEMARLGHSDEEIAVALEIPERRITNWKQRYKDWGPAFDAARRQSELGFPKRQANYDGSFIAFRRIYLAMETTWFQQKAIEAIEATEPGEITMILWPPEHGKTTLLEDYCTFKIANNNGYRVTVGSETLDHGVKMIERVQGRYMPDGPTPAIHVDFGPLAPDKDHHPVWQSRKFNVALRTTDERDYNMRAIGITGRIQGTRCDLLLLDDMQDVKSIDQSEKYFNIIKQSFLSRPSMFGRTVIIGTRVGEFDVYRRLLDARIVDHLVTIPAYSVGSSVTWPAPKDKPKRDDPSTWAPEGVKFLWPEKYDVVDPDTRPPTTKAGFHRFAYAALRFRVGEPTWWRVYMQRPEAATSMAFDEATTSKMLDEYRSIIQDPSPRAPGVPVQVIIGVDPAVGGGNGIVTAAAYPDRLEVLHCRLDYDLAKYEQVVGIIAEECHRYSTPNSVVSLVVIEDKAFQRGLLRMDAMIELQRRFGFRLVPNNTNREKQDPDIGVPAMPLSMIREEITLPYSDEVSVANMGLLLDQLHIWRPGTRGNTSSVKKDKVPQDLVMALWFVWRRWREVARDNTAHRALNPEQWRSEGSPLRRRSRRSTVGRRTTYRSLARGARRR